MCLEYNRQKEKLNKIMDNSKANSPTNIEEFGRWFLRGVFCPSWDGFLLASLPLSAVVSHSALGIQGWAGESGKVALEEDLLGELGAELWVRYEGAKDF